VKVAEIAEMDHGETAFTAGNGFWQNNLVAFGHGHARATFEKNSLLHLSYIV